MKIPIQFVNDAKGKTQSVQLPLAEWEKLLARLNKYEQILKIKSDLEEAMVQVKKLRKSKAKKHTLNDFLKEL